MSGANRIERRRLLRLGMLGAVAAGLSACGRSAAAARPRTGPASPPSQRALPRAASRPSRVPVRREPAFRVHDIHPDAPTRAIALTIDDGPHPEWTPMVLKVLARYRVRATFSMIGIEVERYPDIARKVVAAGHSVCNHSMHHPLPFATLPKQRIVREIADAGDRIEQATGVAPRLFRSPGGDWSPTVLRVVADHGMVPIDWDVDPDDWRRPGTGHIVQTLLRARPGDILLCHDGGGNRAETVAALHTVIPRLQGRGFSFVAL